MDAMMPGVTVDTAGDDTESGTVRAQFEQGETPPSMAVIVALADVMDVDPAELDPLYSSVDPDALDALGCDRHGTDGDIRVRFTHEGHAVTVSSDGVVTITQAHESTPANDASDAGR